MGDIIHTMIALQFIKQHLPNTQIDWIVEESFQAILENNPHIDNILPINLKSIKQNKLVIFKQLKVLNTYAKNNYDLVIDAQGLIKSAIVSKLVGGRTIGSKIVGFDKDSIRESFASWFYDETVSIGYEKNVIDRSLRVICKPLGIEVGQKDILNKDSFLFSSMHSHSGEWERGKFNIILVVGASKPNKIYPKEKFLELAQKLDEKIEVVWGNEDEYEIALWLSEQSDKILLAKKGNLDDLKSKIQNSKLIIGGDTGPTHMAWALNIPSITIFGNTPEYRNTYITDINKVIKSKSIVDAKKLDKNDFSIRDIDIGDIVNLAKGLL